MRRSRAGESSLAGLASRALGWSFANNATARLGALPVGIVLARLLGPHAFGTYAVALVALTAVLSFNDLGVSLAIVRWEGEPAEIAPTVATLSVTSSLITYAGCFLGAPVFASAMGAPAATNVIRVLTLNVIVDGVTATPAALMQRYFRQDRKMIADQVNNWLGVAVSLGLAWQGFGAMSLAVGRMSGAVASGVLFLVFSPEPVRFGFDRAKARALCRFGLPLVGASIVVFAVTNVDQLVVGHMLGTVALGYYALAVNLAAWPVTMFSLPTRAVAPAVFSRLQHDRAAMRTGFLSVAGLLGAGTLPICLLISGAAVPVLGFAYGTQWVPAAHVLVWLAILGALRILFELVYDFFVVLARARVVFTVQLVWLVALVPALIAGVWADGISGAGLAEVAVAGCVVLPWYLAELSKVGITRRALAARLWLPFAAAVVVGAVGAAAARFIHSDLAALAAGGVFALATIGLLGYRMRHPLAALRADFRQRPAPGPAAAAALAAAGATAPAGPAALAGAAGAAGPAGLTGDAATWRAAAEPALALRNGASPRDAALGAREALPVSQGELAPVLTFQDLTGPLPIYRETVASLRWDPASRRPGVMRRRSTDYLGKHDC
jgi:PST family polysaccharide transporter